MYNSAFVQIGKKIKKKIKMISVNVNLIIKNQRRLSFFNLRTNKKKNRT